MEIAEQNVTVESDQYIQEAVSIEDMMAHNMHYGHKLEFQSREMRKYVLPDLCKEKNCFGVINLAMTKASLLLAMKYLRETVKRGQKVLFVGTDPRFSSIVKNAAIACEQHFIAKRWIGGLLTNWRTVMSSLQTMRHLKEILDNSSDSMYTKKELLLMQRQYDKLHGMFEGIENLDKLPNMLVITSCHEKTALHEAKLTGIPYILFADTDSCDTGGKCIVPMNDDASMSIKRGLDYCVQACVLGVQDELNKFEELQRNKQSIQQKKKYVIQGWKK